jgi:hypothetical protein
MSGRRIDRARNRAVDQAFKNGIKPLDLGGTNGTAVVTKAAIGAMD